MSFRPDWCKWALCVSLLAGLSCKSDDVLGQAAQSRKPSDSTAQVEREFRIAKEAEQKNDYDKAVSAYRTILELRPDLAEIHQNLGLVYYMQGKNREAITSFQAALKGKPELPGAQLFLGMAFVRTNQYEKGIPLLSKFIAQNPKEARAYLNLGLCYVETGQPTEAIRVLQAGSANFPEDIDILYNLGKVYTQLMTSTFRKMADVGPDSYRVHQLLAESYEARREIPAAVDEYKLALERAPNVPGLNYALANLYWREGSLEEAERGFTKELAINAEHYLATWKLGNTYLIKREVDKALPYLLKAIDQKPELAQAHRDLGRVYSEKGDFQKAMEHFRLVTKLSPEEPTVHYRMALIHKRLGNKEEEAKEIALFRKLKAASDDREKRATMVERVSSQDETERSKKDADIQAEVN